MTLFDKYIPKIIISSILAITVCTLYLIQAVNVIQASLYYTCVMLCFVLTLCFVKLTPTKLPITVALFCACVADYFLILNYSVTHHPQDQIYGMLAFCALQCCFTVYTYFIIKNPKLKIAMLITRVTVTLCIICVMPILQFGLLEILCAVYIVNFFITLLIVATQIKTRWLMFIGLLLFFICDIFVGLSNGGAALFHLQNVAWLTAHNYSFYFYVPGLLLIALSSVWSEKLHNLTK